MKNIIVIFFLLGWTTSFSQGFFKNSKTLITWNSGDTKQKSSKLKNGGLLFVKFDGYLVNVEIVFGSKGYSIENFEETQQWKKMQITEYDFDKDGKNELVIAYGDKDAATFKVLVYKITKLSAKQIGSFEGQDNCFFAKNKIELPFGSQGLFTEYMLKNGKFVQTN